MEIRATAKATAGALLFRGVRPRSWLDATHRSCRSAFRPSATCPPCGDISRWCTARSPHCHRCPLRLRRYEGSRAGSIAVTRIYSNRDRAVVLHEPAEFGNVGAFALSSKVHPGACSCSKEGGRRSSSAGQGSSASSPAKRSVVPAQREVADVAVDERGGARG
ncbi:MAG: hypothetical protein KY452_00085 [Actinobacteria bacterium]|nr:hypothetical protein [Actinomycetota bacterium]